MNLDGGELIRMCRKKAGLTQRELARLTGLNPTSLWRYETGRDMPRWEKVIWCLTACGYTIELKELKETEDD